MKSKNEAILKILQRYRILNFIAIICGILSFLTGFFLIKANEIHTPWITFNVKLIFLGELFLYCKTFLITILFLAGFGMLILSLFIVDLTKSKKVNDTKNMLRGYVESTVLLPFISLFCLYMLFPVSNPHITYPGRDCYFIIPYSFEYYFSIHTGFIFGLLMAIFAFFDYLCIKDCF